MSCCSGQSADGPIRGSRAEQPCHKGINTRTEFAFANRQILPNVCINLWWSLQCLIMSETAVQVVLTMNKHILHTFVSIKTCTHLSVALNWNTNSCKQWWLQISLARSIKYSLDLYNLKTSAILSAYSCSFQFESCGLVTINLYVN